MKEIVLEVKSLSDCSNVVDNPGKRVRKWLDFTEVNDHCKLGWKVTEIFHGAGKTFAQLKTDQT